jgi:hypothetical protein
MNLEEKKIKYITEVREIFPELAYSSSMSLYSGPEPSSAAIELSNQSLAFKRKFQCSKSIIHYTSIDSLVNILNSEELRLFSCNSLNDERELRFAVEKLGIKISHRDLEEFRRTFFIFSACEYDLDKLNDDFNLWRLYANSGNGVAIVFEMTNYEDDWRNVFYGKVAYDGGNSVEIELLRFSEIHNKFNEEHSLFENTPSILPAIALHFKNRIWEIEREVRLMAYCPFDEYTLQAKSFEGGNPYLPNTVRHTVSRGGILSSYVCLPLNKERLRKQFETRLDKPGSEHLLSCIPHLKIRKIIVGHNVPDHTFSAIKRLSPKINVSNEVNSS